MEKVKRKLDLITMPCWTYKEIMEYTGVCSKTTAIKIKKRAVRMFGGEVPYGDQYIATEAVLLLLGTTRKTEITLLKEALNEEELQQADINQ